MRVSPLAFRRAGAPPDPAFAASAEITTSSTTNHDITLALASGTNRLVLITASAQTSGLNFTSGVFDQGGGDSAAMTIVGEAVTGQPNTQAIYYYYVPDGVSAGNKTVRIVSDTTVDADVFAVQWNNVGGSAPSSTDTHTGDFDPNPLTGLSVTVANVGDLVVSACGTDATTLTYSPSSPLTRRLDLNGGSGGSSSTFADSLATSAGALAIDWTRDAGASGATDGALVAAVFPHL